MARKNAAPPCSICAGPAVAHGYCDKHYRRWKALGDPAATRRPSDWGKREKHPLYGRWAYMRRVRGGRSPVWSDFWVFVADAGEPPSSTHVLCRRKIGEPWGPDNFYWRKQHPTDGLGTLEKRAAYIREWRKRNPHRAKQSDLRKCYGIDIIDYAEMLEAQNGLCAICASEPPPAKMLCVDHCHATGKVRGLLCDPCNRGLGSFQDSTERLSRAIAYLTPAGP